jgi:hypothetical protein
MVLCYFSAYATPLRVQSRLRPGKPLAGQRSAFPAVRRVQQGILKRGEPPMKALTAVFAFARTYLHLRPFARYVAHIVCLTIAIAPAVPSGAWADSACKAIENSLLGHKKQLAEYMEILRDLNDKRDAERIRTITANVNQLSVIINHVEAELADCYGDGRTQSPRGMAHIKTDEQDEYASKSCSVLQRTLLQLIRTINVLKRRENSIFSQLTAEEQAELRSAERKEEKVRAALKKRCETRKKPRRR